MAEYLKLEWWNSCDIQDAGLFYQSNYRNRIYLDVDIGKPEYVLTRDVKEDGEGSEQIKQQRWQKQYGFTIVAPEYMADALTLAQAHSDIRLTSKYDEVANINGQNFNVTVNWVKSGYAEITATFYSEYVFLTACCGNFDYGCFAVSENVINQIEDTNVIYTAPLSNGVQDGDVYLVLDSGDNGNVYEYSTSVGDWVSRAYSQGGYVYDDTNSVNWYYDGLVWRVVPKITSLSRVGDDITIKGFGLPDTFVTLYYKCETDSVWIELESTIITTFFLTGITVDINDLTLGVGCTGIDFKFNSWTHTCDYDYSGVANIST